MRRNCVDRFFGFRRQILDNAKLEQPLNGNPSTMSSCRACGDFTTSMGACASCGHRNEQISPAVEQLRSLLRQHDARSATGVLHRHKGNQNVTTNSSVVANNVEPAISGPRDTTHRINGRICSAGVPASTSSASSERSGPAKCIWSDDELLDSLRRDSRYIYIRPMARGQRCSSEMPSRQGAMHRAPTTTEPFVSVFPETLCVPSCRIRPNASSRYLSVCQLDYVDNTISDDLSDDLSEEMGQIL
jgi:hypothetical protein